MSGSRSDEARLTALMASVSNDPLMFVKVAFPWGEKGTELEHHTGPDVWQTKVLSEIRDGLRTPDHIIQEAVASGNGVGKSSLVAWLVLWCLATFPGAKAVVTANTEGQLRTKTWPEAAKWWRMCIAKHWFRMTATSIFTVDPDQALEWRADAIPWSETNPQAFAGLHNHEKRLLLIMDEASEINDIIWETAEGAMTDANTQILWCVFGNPTQNTGRFRECFDRFKHRWNTHHVDQRQSRLSNKVQIKKWLEDYDEDDDWFRIHVRGVFPRHGARQFISGDVVRAAASKERDIIPTVYDALVMGCDIARFGDNDTVIRFRRGRDARSIPPTKMHGADTMAVAAKIASLYEEYRPDAVLCDEGGVGGGVIDRLRMLKIPVIGVQFGARDDNPQDHGEGRINYYNKRSAIFGAVRDWLPGGMIDNDQKLIDGLSAANYTHRTVNGIDAILLEKKEDVMNRTKVSMDDADALACTFAYPIQKSDHTAIIASRGRNSGYVSDYQPYSEAWAAGGQTRHNENSKEYWLPGAIRPLQQ